MRWINSFKLEKERVFKQVVLPQDFTTMLSPKALAYCYIRGLTDSDLKKYKVGFSPFYNRLILPVYKDRELVFWEGRALGEVTRKNPKYIKRIGRDWQGCLFDVKAKSNNFLDYLVLTEDMISTIRVGKVVDSMAMVSTHIRDKLIFDIFLESKYKVVIIWLDPDKNAKSVSLSFKYRQFGLPVISLSTKLDPKWYDEKEIRSIIHALVSPVHNSLVDSTKRVL
jgi:hypothetical protein